MRKPAVAHDARSVFTYVRGIEIELKKKKKQGNRLLRLGLARAPNRVRPLCEGTESPLAHCWSSRPGGPSIESVLECLETGVYSQEPFAEEVEMAELFAVFLWQMFIFLFLLVLISLYD